MGDDGVVREDLVITAQISTSLACLSLYCLRKEIKILKPGTSTFLL